MNNQQQIMFLGGGLGDLYAACALKRTPVQVTLNDRRSFNLFRPSLYQIATGELSTANIRRVVELKAKGIHDLDVGTSGGVWRSERGCCLMIGGGEDDFAKKVLPALRYQFGGHVEKAAPKKGDS